MQLTDKDGNVFGTGGLEITTSSGKPKIPVINTDITIGTTAIVGGVAGRLLYDNAGVVGETGGINWNPVSSTLSLLDSPFYSQAGNSSANTDFSITGTANSNYTIYSSRQFIFNTGQSMYFNTDTDGGSALDRAWYFAGARSGITGGRTYGALTVDSSGFPSFTLYNNDNGARILLASNTTSYFNGGNLLVGTTTDAGFKLDVIGTTRVTSLRTADIFPASANISLWVNSLNASSRFYTAPVHQDGRINFNAIAGGSDQVLIRAWHTGQFGLGTGSSSAGGALTIRGDSLLIGTSGSLFFMNGTFGPLNVPYRLGISTSATTAAFYSGVGNNQTNIESTKFEFTATSHTFYTGTTTGNQSNPNQFIPLNLSNLGNVTIGSTTDAGFRLDVAGTARVQVSSAGIPNILNISNLQTDAGPGGAIAFYTGGVVGNASRIVAQRSGSVGQSDIALETNGVRRLFVSANDGNVGIGTINPTSKLYLDGGVFTKKYYTDTSNNTVSFGSGYELFGTLHSSAGYSFYIYPAGWNSGWDVKIGDNSNNFSFSSTGGFGANKITTGELTLGGGIISYYKLSPASGFSFTSANGWDFVLRGTSDEKFRVKGNGNFLINTTTDAGYKFDVNGTVRSQGNLFFGTAGSYLLGDTNNIRLIDKNGQTILQSFPTGVNNSETYLRCANSTISFLRLRDDYMSLEWANSNISSTAQNPIQITRGYFGNVGATDKSVLYVKSTAFSNLNNATTLRGIFIDINDTTTFTGFTTARAIEAPRGGAYFNTTLPQSSAILQADSTTQGFLPPRMTNAQMLAISTPATGLMVYDTTNNKLCCYDGTTWQNLF